MRVRIAPRTPGVPSPDGFRPGDLEKSRRAPRSNDRATFVRSASRGWHLVGALMGGSSIGGAPGFGPGGLGSESLAPSSSNYLPA